MMSLVDMPTGTVTLLFSDIESSTLLLSRLGPAYAEALDGQRQVLRRAWAEHRGTELGTEGDSFFVAFHTAPDAVAAAAQSQRQLETYPWPQGSPVRVRMGVHTGTPTLHDGGYVGMDVHRAARIAGGAHGGQVVVSAATAELAGGCLPDGVGLRDLGSHRLKDITQLERLFQLTIDGLAADFPPLKTLGASTSLSRPGTPLVGRSGELATLITLIDSPDVRLLTLTGPGGTGKTRLAIGLTERLVESFPDGVYFVPLATVRTADVMWTSIAEILNVPAAGRMPPAFFEYVAHRAALFVLDNIEQIEGADEVVEELLDHGTHVVVIATSRKPLALPAEHRHPVPPLEVPEDTTLDRIKASGAVRLFVQQARKVKPSFALSAENAVDVLQICRRLDGLPLAIELAAARIRLLAPRALLARLGNALDIAAPGSQVLARHKTLRDTIAWSYDLLTVEQQAFFRRLGAIAGGADLDSVEAVTAGLEQQSDPLDAIADLVDASLVTITEDSRGEPRVGMLRTVREFALERLQTAGELEDAQRVHSGHYLAVARDLRERLPAGGAEQLLDVRRRFQVELDNFREILRWGMEADDAGVGLRMYREVAGLWMDGGHLSEWKSWLDRAIKILGDDDSPELGRCLSDLALFLSIHGDLSESKLITARSVALWRRLGDERGLAHALVMWANCERLLDGDLQAARRACEEAETLARSIGFRPLLADALERLAELEADGHNFQQSLDLHQEALDIRRERGDERGVLNTSQTIAWTLRGMGRLEDAEQQLREQIPQMLRLADPGLLTEFVEDYAAVLADLREYESAARLLGAADEMRERDGTFRDPFREAEIQEPVAKAQATASAGAWDREYRRGHHISVEDALTQAQARNV